MLMRPLTPSEQATPVNEKAESSYVVSYVTLCCDCAKAGRTSARVAAARGANIIVLMRRGLEEEFRALGVGAEETQTPSQDVYLYVDLVR